MSSDKTLLFLNPAAARGRAGKRQQKLVNILTLAGVNIELHLSADAGDLEQQVFECAMAGAARIVVAGGDGSVHEAANGILRSQQPVQLGVIPSGTGNDFAKACDIPLNWEHAAALLADRITAGQTPRTVDAGRCNERFFVNGAGVGFDAKVNRIARAIRLPVGDLVYLLAIFKGLIDGVTTPNIELTSGEQIWNGPLTLAQVSNGPWVGGMFLIAPMASNSDQQLDLIYVHPVTRRRILSLLPKLIKGSHIGEPEIVYQPLQRLTIQADQDLPSHLDGEVQPLQSRFEIELLPGALRLL